MGFCLFLVCKEQTALVFKVNYLFLQHFGTATEIFRQAAYTHKAFGAAVYHTLVQAYFVVPQDLAAVFTLCHYASITLARKSRQSWAGR